MKKYSVIYAYPPWRYRVYSKKGLGRSAESHYPTMSLKTSRLCPLESLQQKTVCSSCGLPFPVCRRRYKSLRHGDLNIKRRLLSGSSRTGCPTASFGAWGTGPGQCGTLHPCNERPSQTGKRRCTSGHHEPHRRALQETGGSPQPHRPAHGRCPAHRTFRSSVPRRLGCLGQRGRMQHHAWKGGSQWRLYRSRRI